MANNRENMLATLSTARLSTYSFQQPPILFGMLYDHNWTSDEEDENNERKKPPAATNHVDSGCDAETNINDNDISKSSSSLEDDGEDDVSGQQRIIERGSYTKNDSGIILRRRKIRHCSEGDLSNTMLKNNTGNVVRRASAPTKSAVARRIDDNSTATIDDMPIPPRIVRRPEPDIADETMPPLPRPVVRRPWKRPVCTFLHHFGTRPQALQEHLPQLQHPGRRRLRPQVYDIPTFAQSDLETDDASSITINPPPARIVSTTTTATPAASWKKPPSIPTQLQQGPATDHMFRTQPRSLPGMMMMGQFRSSTVPSLVSRNLAQPPDASTITPTTSISSIPIFPICSCKLIHYVKGKNPVPPPPIIKMLAPTTNTRSRRNDAWLPDSDTSLVAEDSIRMPSTTQSWSIPASTTAEAPISNDDDDDVASNAQQQDATLEQELDEMGVNDLEGGYKDEDDVDDEEDKSDSG